MRTDNYLLLYHFSVHPLAESLLRTIRKQKSFNAGDRVGAAISGGADSVALLRLLIDLRDELGIVLSVAHVNHKLRGEESDEDELFVANLAQQHRLELHACAAPLKKKVELENASRISSGIEAAARKLRYDFFRQLARENRVTKIATAHTLDDQAETLLLRIFRGTGIRGLSSIHPRLIFPDEAKNNNEDLPFGEVIRPLLEIRRAALLEFLRERNQNWREDSSNQDVTFLRNRVRHHLLPIIQHEFGESAIEHMAELAEIARAEEEHWHTGHPEIQPPISILAGPDKLRSPSLRLAPLLSLSLAAQRRLVRAWLEASAPVLSVSFRLIEEALDLATRAPGGKVELLHGWNLRRGRHDLLLETEALANPEAVDYQRALPVPGTVEIPELGVCIDAREIAISSVPEVDRSQLLDPKKIPNQLRIRNWHAGDRYWPAHTASPRKVKDLLSDRHVTGAEKKRWPVAVAPDLGLVWLRGFAVPAAFRPPDGAVKAIWIRQIDGMI